MILAYHTTNKKFNKFDINTLGQQSDHPSAHLGFYFFSNIKQAEEFAKDINGWTEKYYLDLKNPYIMEAKEFEEELDFWRGVKNSKYGHDEYFRSRCHFEDTATWIQDRKYDGIIIQGGKTKYPELDYDNYVVFNSDQIYTTS